MKEIDNIVKKVLLESLNEKADEITNKIHNKLSSEMKEIGFKQGLALEQTHSVSVNLLNSYLNLHFANHIRDFS